MPLAPWLARERRAPSFDGTSVLSRRSSPQDSPPCRLPSTDMLAALRAPTGSGRVETWTVAWPGVLRGGRERDELGSLRLLDDQDRPAHPHRRPHARFPFLPQSIGGHHDSA